MSGKFDLKESDMLGLIIARLEGRRLVDPRYRNEALNLLKDGLAGFVVFGGEAAATGKFLEEARKVKADGRELVVASDIERGMAQQFSDGSAFPCQMSVASALRPGEPADCALLRRALRVLAFEAKSAGINMPLMPVMDLQNNPRSPIVQGRAFSDSPALAAALGRIYVEELSSAGLLPCLKHFPGHGPTAVDSHRALPLIEKPYDRYRQEDISAFEEVIAGADVPAVMIGHLRVPVSSEEKTDAPALFEPSIVTELLKKELGFRGLVVTDALTMEALKEEGDLEARALEAGVDVLLHPESPRASAKRMLKALKEGRLSFEALERANDNLESFLERPGRYADLRTESEPLDRAAPLEIQARSVVLVGGSEAELLETIAAHGIKEIEEAGEEDLVARSTFSELLPSERKEDGVALIALHTSSAAWRGSAGIGDKEIERLKSLTGGTGHSVVIAFGAPYALEAFPEAVARVAAHESSEGAFRAVADCLSGRRSFSGRLTVEL